MTLVSTNFTKQIKKTLHKKATFFSLKRVKFNISPKIKVEA